eukprot:1162101-Pelagomonas_calceolata.AAC.10
MRGQRVPLVTMTPFSVEKESDGRPWMFQSRTALGSARNMEKSKFSDAGMLSAFTCNASKRARMKGVSQGKLCCYTADYTVD